MSFTRTSSAILLLLLLSPLTLAQSYFYAGENVLAVKDSTGINYLSQDRLGSNRVVHDSTQQIIEIYQHLPFGQNVHMQSQTIVGFTGKEQDSSQLHYFGARYYDSNNGIFTSIDPIEDSYPYQYVHNNPINKIDPDGKATVILPVSYDRYYYTPSNGGYDPINAASMADALYERMYTEFLQLRADNFIGTPEQLETEVVRIATDYKNRFLAANNWIQQGGRVEIADVQVGVQYFVTEDNSPTGNILEQSVVFRIPSPYVQRIQYNRPAGDPTDVDLNRFAGTATSSNANLGRILGVPIDEGWMNDQQAQGRTIYATIKIGLELIWQNPDGSQSSSTRGPYPVSEQFNNWGNGHTVPLSELQTGTYRYDWPIHLSPPE